MPDTTPSLVAVAVSKTPNMPHWLLADQEVADVEDTEDEELVFELLNSGIQPPSANPDARSGRNIFISGRLEKLDTISSI